MPAKTILALCCVLALSLAGTAMAAETGPALAFPAFDEIAPAPSCSPASVSQSAQPDLGGGPVTEAACPASVWQACYQRYGSCTLCYCLGSCFCENRCV